MYSETRNMTPYGSLDSDAQGGVANKTQNFEVTAQYQFDFGLRPAVSFLMSKGKDLVNKGVNEDKDLVKYADVGATYYFNKTSPPMLIIKSTCWMTTITSMQITALIPMTLSRWVWFTSSNYSLILLKPAVSAGFSFITTVLKTERTVPGHRLNNSCSLSMVCLSPDKRNMLMISLVPPLLSRTALLFLLTATGAATAARPAADIILHNGNIITLNDAQPQASALAISARALWRLAMIRRQMNGAATIPVPSIYRVKP